MKLQTPIVSTDWLDDHLGEPGLRIYDVTLYVEYKGDAFEVKPASDDFPNGLVMVRTATTDLGVPITYIQGR